MISEKEDERHGSPCPCGDESCAIIRVISMPSKPMGFKVWAGDWFKKTYGHDMGERDKAYASEQAALDEQVRQLKRDHGISVDAKAKRKDT
jgi:hypothetical protein